MRFEIPGRPVPYQRSRTQRSGRPYLPERYREYRARAVKAFAGERPTVTGLVSVRISVRSDGVDVEVVEVDGPARPKHVRGDLDNYAKAVLDALQASAYPDRPELAPPVLADDRQVVELVVRFD